MRKIKGGNRVIDTQIATSYGSSSDFHDTFSRIIEATPTQMDDQHIFKAACLDTPLGPMVAIANDESLCLLEFIDRRVLEREIKKLREKMCAAITSGENAIIEMIKHELTAYFSGKKYHFETPLRFIGTPFQQKVWRQLSKIPIGETRSYADIAQSVKKPTAYRAVANANGANQLAIIIPCHRVINSNGELGGYGGGLNRKQWLLNHESQIQS